MQICKTCVLDENFPRITFDKNGVCNYCQAAQGDKSRESRRAKYEQKFLALISKFKGKSNYDCLVAFSGGKDSTYTLELIKNKYGLIPLAFSYDNWFQSERTSINIRNTLKHLNVDHITVLPSFTSFKEIMRLAASGNFYPPVTLERASTICTTCLSLIRFVGYKIAIEKEIPFLIFGLSPGQASLATSVFKSNPEMVRKMQNVIYKPLRTKLGNMVDPFFLHDYHFKNSASFPYVINPLAFLEYDESKIMKKIKTLGWIKPDDTDANSTNCLLNALANQNHVERYGFNPYASEIAVLVRDGKLNREEGLKRLNEPFPEKQIKAVKEKLGF